MPKFLDNKKLVISLIVLSLFILVGLAVYFLYQKQAGIIPSAGEKKEETLAEKQLKELEELRKQADVQPLTEQQKATQLKELEDLRKKANIKPLSQKQIQKPAQEGRGSLNEIERQSEELDRLRLGQ